MGTHATAPIHRINRQRSYVAASGARAAGRRIGVLSALAEADPESMARRPAFEQALKVLTPADLRTVYLHRFAAATPTCTMRCLSTPATPTYLKI
jgi:hypothetical protein